MLMEFIFVDLKRMNVGCGICECGMLRRKWFFQRTLVHIDKGFAGLRPGHGTSAHRQGINHNLLHPVEGCKAFSPAFL